MRPVRLTMEGFASFRNRTELDFTDADYFALVGPTGSGKSTVIDAITFALYGTVHRWRDAKSIANALAPSTNRGFVSLVFDSGGQRYRVAREIRRTTGKSAGVKTSNIAFERYLDPSATPAPSIPGAAGAGGPSQTREPQESPEAVNLLGDSTDIRALTPLVVDIVGLDLKDFNQCVVLPQGDFAQFLHASRPERQTILLKLLDVGHNERIRQAASSRAGVARTEAATLTSELATLGDGSEEAEKAATAARELLETLHGELSGQIATWDKVLADHVEAHDAARSLSASLRTLQEIETPENVAELSERLARTRTERDARRSEATDAAEALSAATLAASEGPDRSHVQGLLAQHGRLDALTEARGGLEDTVHQAGQARTLAEERASATRQAAEAATAALAQATTRAREASALVEQHQSVLGRLRVQTPADLDSAVQALEVARDAESVARTALGEADAQYATASARVSELTAAGLEPRTLHSARDELVAAAESLLTLPTAAERTATAGAALSSAEAAYHSARDSFQDAEAALESARLAGTGASLRSALQVGHDCPVCTQQVTTLPATAPDDAQDEALRVRNEAQTSLEGARTARETAARQAAAAAQAQRAALERAAHAAQAGLRAAPPTLPDLLTNTGTGSATGGGPVTASADGYAEAHRSLANLADQLSQAATLSEGSGTVSGTNFGTDSGTDSGTGAGVLDGVPVAEGAGYCRRLAADLDAAASLAQSHHQAESEARTKERGARKSAETAAAHLDAVRQAHAQAHTRLAQAAGALADQGAPDATTLLSQHDIAGAWAALDSWATTAAAALRDGPLARAQESSSTAASDLDAAEKTHQDALGASRAAEAALRDATVAADRADGALARAITEADELVARLAGEPDTDTLLGDRATADRLAEAVRSANATTRSATVAAKTAETAHASVVAEAEMSAAELRQARDSVSALRPPDLHAVAGAGLAEQWATLASWATATAEGVAAEADRRSEQARSLNADLNAWAEQIADLLNAQGLALRPEQVDVDQNLARAAVSVVALASSQAQSGVEEVLAIRARGARLKDQIAQATVRSQVAGDLAALLGTNKFSQWLADSVLDQLVATAADSLRTLSNGQFSLTHRGGDFFVIDHNDADQTRSVRTLSGGETFQTSLALALALSEQLAALGSGGTGRLESIFLDEGFGTLDPEALDTVAVTLESLAQGHRMVGVVTHVPALAERIPTRFQVRRIDNASTIVTDTLDIP